MARKSREWRQWMPLHIDELRGNPRVQAMSDAAFRGFINLLMAQWQTDDCTLPTEDTELAVLSGLRHKWKRNAHAVRAMFDTVSVTVSGTDTERLRDADQYQYEEWTKAKGMYISRSAGAHRTNEKRSAQRSPSAVSGTVTASTLQDSSCNPVTAHRGTETTTVTGTETSTEAEVQEQKQQQKQKPGADPPALPAGPPDAEADEVEFPEGLSELQYGWRVLETAAIQGGDAMQKKMGGAIAKIARKKQCNMPTAARRMLKRIYKAKSEGVTQWYKWLEEGGWDEDTDFHLKEPVE